MKTRLPQGLLSYMELLKNMFSTVLGMKNSNKVKKKLKKKFERQTIVISLSPPFAAEIKDTSFSYLKQLWLL